MANTNNKDKNSNSRNSKKSTSVDRKENTLEVAPVGVRTKNSARKGSARPAQQKSSFVFTDFTSLNVSISKENLTFEEFGVSAVADTNQNLYGSIRINFDRLKQQANVFANQIFMNADVSFYHLFGERDKKIQLTRLEQLYIYSYVKSYLYGSRQVPNDCIFPDSLAFSGHALMFSLLRKRIISNVAENNVNIRKELYVNDDDHMYNSKGISENFPFLPSLDDYSLRFSYSSPEYERWMNGLSTQNVNWLSFCCLDKTSSVDTFAHPTDCPLFNSGYSDLNSDKFLYMACPPGTIKDYSVCFNKACFIYLKQVDTKNENCLFRSYLVKELDVLTKYDVGCITTLRPKLDPRPDEIAERFRVKPRIRKPRDGDDFNDPNKNINKNKSSKLGQPEIFIDVKNRKFDLGIQSRQPGVPEDSPSIISGCISDIDLTDYVQETLVNSKNGVDTVIDKEKFKPIDYGALTSLNDEDKERLRIAITEHGLFFSPSNFIYDEANDVIATSDLRNVIIGSLGKGEIKKKFSKKSVSSVNILRNISAMVLKCAGILTEVSLKAFLTRLAKERFKTNDNLIEISVKDTKINKVMFLVPLLRLATKGKTIRNVNLF
jgi:hypothetical protein